MSVTPGIDPNTPVYPEKDTRALTPSATPEWVPIEQGGWPIGQVDPDNLVYPEVDTTLLPGVPGQRGPRGPRGEDSLLPADIPALVSFTYTQVAPSNVWSVAHSLDFYPNATVFDSAGTMVEGSITHTDQNTLVIAFSASISGTAHLS